ncbi:MAG: hypothetical protein M1358_19730, partial [Chloroflexi bacterium]|nr:hypothetical protein [Chloroflexota bacterium]
PENSRIFHPCISKCSWRSRRSVFPDGPVRPSPAGLRAGDKPPRYICGLRQTEALFGSQPDTSEHRCRKRTPPRASFISKACREAELSY